MLELTEVEKAYIAGFFDGEGCISIVKTQPTGKHKTPVYSLIVILSQNGKVPLYELRDKTGIGTIYEKVRIPGVYNYQIRSIEAATFLNTVLPYLKSKREQAEVAIEFQSRQGYKNSKGTGWIVPQAMIDEREMYYRKLRELKGTSANRGRPKKAASNLKTETV